ncbi:flagellar hook-basal body complex protein FliE [Microbulbifer sediminum]|uniref:flagellar hook-basal body complex protein FliE n=1 Tax=Microbulbifer sediminum TaxID=2904250 RepID=UPI001F01B6B7|nr:flagellar hook-basal body complex protein FliE [Microbulbifer sediminum]
MAIEPISEIRVESLVPTRLQKAEPEDFSSWIAEQLGELDGQIQRSESALQDLALGKAENIHDVMFELEKSRTAFQLTLQVRNKVLEGYQEIMRMQV